MAGQLEEEEDEEWESERINQNNGLEVIFTFQLVYFVQLRTNLTSHSISLSI